MPRYKISFCYDGTRYCGWQTQKNGHSIQEVMQKAFSAYFRDAVSITASGRTDAGVHALAQTAHFDRDPLEAKKVVHALAALLPPDIRVFNLEEVPPLFHARYSAKGKIYRYQIGLQESPFLHLYQWHIRFPLSREKLLDGAKKLLGTHDFKGFANEATKGIASYDSIRTLTRVDIQETEEAIFIEFEGDGFLRKMARNCVGTLVDIARGHLPLSTIDKLFHTHDRSYGGQSAPAKGLFLVKVIY